MIIDFHTHFYPEKIVEKALETARTQAHIEPAATGTRTSLLDSMRSAGIDRAVALPLVTAPGRGPGLIEWAKRNNGAPITMLGSVHPRDPEFSRTLELAQAAGFPGIKVHPEYQSFEFDEPELDGVWARMAEMGFFLITHAGADGGFPPPYHSNPASLRRLHDRHPNLKLVLAHGGSWNMWDDVLTFLAGTPVWIDLAFVTEVLEAERVRELIRRFGVERCLFGTDSPWCDQRRALENIRGLKLGKYAEEMILGGNARQLLGNALLE